MALWEYKVITSGQHGFASLALLEAHLNSLGKDEWEIVHFQTLPNNPLAFNGLVRRSTVRDWTPPEPVAAPSKPAAVQEAPEPVKPAKPEPAQAEPSSSEDKAPIREESIRPMRNTERDLDPDAEDEEDDWDSWVEEEDELPTFFEAIKPHLRRNQKGPGQAVALDYLAKRWEQKESDIVGALKECGITVPEDEETDPEYFEFEGDLYWVNRNNRGQLFLNTREKPRPVFRTAPATKLSPDDPATAELVAERAAEKAEIDKRNKERAERQAAAQAAAQARAEAQAARAAAQSAAAGSAAAPKDEGEATGSGAAAEPAPTVPAPTGPELLDLIRPLMRRNRRGPGYSGSVSFLARALHFADDDLVKALAGLGLHIPANAGDKPVYVDVGLGTYWVNKDGRGGIWINGREKREQGGKPDSQGGASDTNGAADLSSEAPALPPEAVPQAEAKAAEPTATTSEGAAGDTLPPPEGTDEGSQPTAAPSPQSSEAPAEPSVTEAPFSDTTAPFAENAVSSGDPVLAAVRLLLKANKRGSGFSGEVGFLARSLGQSEEDFVGSLTKAGLAVPADAEAKPTFVEQAGEIFWFNRNATDQSLWVNAKAAKGAKRPSRPRAKKPKAEEPSSES